MSDESKAPELLPCPAEGTFQTGLHSHALLHKTGDLTGFGHFVECECGWAGPIADSPERATELWNRRATTAPSAEGQRDLTPEEALAEAKKRWGEDAGVEFRLKRNGRPYFRIIKNTFSLSEGIWISDQSFRAAFEAASKAEKKSGK